MKVPTRRWGNIVLSSFHNHKPGLNESPHPKVGKSPVTFGMALASPCSLNESPHPKVGKYGPGRTGQCEQRFGLNESPHPKVGKFELPQNHPSTDTPQ